MSMSVPALRTGAFARVTLDADGNLAVSWSDHFGGNRSYDVFARQFGSGAIARDVPFAPSTKKGAQDDPDVAMSPPGALTVVWSSDGFDGKGAGVFMQRYEGGWGPDSDGSGTDSAVNCEAVGAVP